MGVKGMDTKHQLIGKAVYERRLSVLVVDGVSFIGLLTGKLFRVVQNPLPEVWGLKSVHFDNAREQWNVVIASPEFERVAPGQLLPVLPHPVIFHEVDEGGGGRGRPERAP